MSTFVGEVWKDIQGYEGIYQISNYGRVLSLYRQVRCRGGAHRGKEQSLLKPCEDSAGYLLVVLSDKGVKKSHRIHRLIATGFISNSYNYKCVNHIDGNKTNNSIDNLEWCTHLHNNVHALNTGLRVSLKGEDAVTSKLTDKKVLGIKFLLGESIPIRKIAALFSISQTSVFCIKSGKTWRHVGVPNVS